MAGKSIVTTDGKKGGNLTGKPHKNKQGTDVGGIKAVVTDANDRPVELEGGEVIINKEASKKHWKELSKINQSAGNGVPIGEPVDPHDEDPQEFDKGGKIQFNPNKLPNKWILKYAQNIKKNHPEIWKKGGNIYGNQAFRNLERVAERGYWLDSEEWFYIKWRSFVARHKGDFRIAGVVAMLKWVDKVDRGWQYMKNLIQDEIKKIEARKSKKSKGGWTVPKAERKFEDGGEVEYTCENETCRKYYVGEYNGGYCSEECKEEQYATGGRVSPTESANSVRPNTVKMSDNDGQYYIAKETKGGYNQWKKFKGQVLSIGQPVLVYNQQKGIIEGINPKEPEKYKLRLENNKVSIVDTSKTT
jgi:hypothetical protein